jgi:CheY-like chemotaxis protein
MPDQLQNPRSPAPASKGYVLVVDDEAYNRTLLRDPLEARGYEVAEAENGRQALQKVAERSPEVILLDIMMPQMDGFEVCRRLKRDAHTAPIPILMITALSERKERLMGIEAGANDFLNKPVDMQDIALRVANAVYTKHLFDQLQAERERADFLLRNILPDRIAERMKKGEVNIADSFPHATLLFAELVNFTSLTTDIGATQVVYILNEIFSIFDLLAEKQRLEKIKTVGGSYLLAAGIPLAQPAQTEAVADLALQMRKELERFNRDNHTSVPIRIGISTGPVVAGVIGRKKFAYDLWGETVDRASGLGATGEPGSIQVDEATFDILKSRFRFEEKPGLASIGRTEMAVYRLLERIP